jgi:hypothetical protein
MRTGGTRRGRRRRRRRRRMEQNEITMIPGRDHIY